MHDYKLPPNELLGFERIGKAHRYSKWIENTIYPFIGNRILELGCGCGNMTEIFLRKELVLATDINEDYLRIVRNRYQSYPNVTIDLLDLNKVDMIKYKRFSFDTIVCLNVLEHLEDDTQVLKAMKEVLIPGGRLIILVPAVKFIYSAHDRDAGHFRRYARKELISKIRAADFELEQCFYFNFIGFWGWLLSSKFLKRNMYSETHLSIFEKMVPINCYLENIIKPPIGLSLVCICQK